MDELSMPAAREFRDDDAGYLAWLAAHADGYVINIARSHSTAEARVHHAACWTISGDNPRRGDWTGPYVKVCADSLTELEHWASDRLGHSLPPCGTCRPAPVGRQGNSTKPARRTAMLPAPAGRCEIHGPSIETPAVEAWAEDYIRFEGLPDWQIYLRNAIRSRCRELEPFADQVLHATYFGPKKLNADIENLVLYNIDTFKVAGHNGIRFEYGADVPPAPDGGEYPFGYRYALTPRTGRFAHWQQGRILASFDWIDLGAFGGGKKLAQTWLALARGDVRVFESATPEAPFAVRVHVRPPVGHQPVWGGLVKGIFDGVICAFQAHTDAAILPEVATRLAKYLPASPVEIAGHLFDQGRAVLPVVHRLVSPYRDDVKWDPADHFCVAGELLATESVGSRWAIKGELIELSR
jgi:hypothetical protein